MEEEWRKSLSNLDLTHVSPHYILCSFVMDCSVMIPYIISTQYKSKSVEVNYHIITNNDNGKITCVQAQVKYKICKTNTDTSSTDMSSGEKSVIISENIDFDFDNQTVTCIIKREDNREDE